MLVNSPIVPLGIIWSQILMSFFVLTFIINGGIEWTRPTHPFKSVLVFQTSMTLYVISRIPIKMWGVYNTPKADAVRIERTPVFRLDYVSTVARQTNIRLTSKNLFRRRGKTLYPILYNKTVSTRTIESQIQRP